MVCLEWKSFKLPRVACYSLSAEAQAAGVASGSADLICRFWGRIFFPKTPLDELLRNPP